MPPKKESILMRHYVETIVVKRVGGDYTRARSDAA